METFSVEGKPAFIPKFFAMVAQKSMSRLSFKSFFLEFHSQLFLQNANSYLQVKPYKYFENMAE